jgi:hypothetical protein
MDGHTVIVGNTFVVFFVVRVKATVVVDGGDGSTIGTHHDGLYCAISAQTFIRVLTD